MKWIQPQYSKKQVQRAGEHLVHAELESDDFEKAVRVLHNWRSSHAFPMQVMLDLLRKNAIRIDKRAIAVQRLKRAGSIFNKLFREKGMSLSRMEDIGGCRVVLSDVRYVYKLHQLLKKSRTKNILHRERDYLSEPKQSGYRGVHLIYKYNGRKSEFQGMTVELQIRSQIQHSWATSVEVFGTYTKQALKASVGTEEWLQAFRLISVELARLEKCPVSQAYNEVDTFTEMDRLIKKLNISDRLLAFKVATQAIAERKSSGAGYYIMRLDLDERVVQYQYFPKNKLDEATEFYNELEDSYRGNEQVDVVMVSANSVNELKRAYPNYFVDTSAFEGYLGQIYNAYK